MACALPKFPQRAGHVTQASVRVVSSEKYCSARDKCGEFRRVKQGRKTSLGCVTQLLPHRNLGLLPLGGQPLKPCECAFQCSASCVHSQAPCTSLTGQELPGSINFLSMPRTAQLLQQVSTSLVAEKSRTESKITCNI